MAKEQHMLPVNEIFTSVQGEGLRMGQFSNFIRLSGCNLKCPWCDTDHSEHTMMTEREIVAKLEPAARHAIITGGEPLMHDIADLVEMLLVKHFKVALETNGTFDYKGPRPIWIACSPKPPKYEINIDADEIKLVVDDVLDIGTITRMHMCTYDHTPIWLQPLAQDPTNSWRRALSLQEQAMRTLLSADVRVGIQLHKALGVQ